MLRGKEKEQWDAFVERVRSAETVDEKVIRLHQGALARGEYDPIRQVLTLSPAFALRVGLYGVGLTEEEHDAYIVHYIHVKFDVDTVARTVPWRPRPWFRPALT